VATTSATTRILTMCRAFAAGGLIALALAVAPTATADSIGGGTGAARNDIGAVHTTDPGAARNDVGATGTHDPGPVDVGRLLNEIDNPLLAPKPESVPAPSTTGTADEPFPYVTLGLGAIAGLALGGGLTAAVVVRRHHAHSLATVA
jgi:hypothetical protein